MDIIPFLDRPTAIVGTTGAGKTFLAKSAVERLLDLGRRVIILDPTGAWWGLRAGADGSAGGGFPVLIFGGDHADISVEPTADAGRALALALADRDVQAIIDTSEMTGGEKNRFLTPFLENLYARNKAALHLIVDEADEVAAQRLADGEQRLFGAFDKIVRRGRIKGFRPMMISQRPAVIHKNVLSQIGTLFALKLTSPQDRKAIDDWVKGNADADQAKAVMSSLPTLKRGEGWIWSPADNVLDRVTFPPIRTYDSSRTPGDEEVIVEPALTAVDVQALREAMQVKPATKPAQNMPADMQERIAAAERNGFERGWTEGNREGRALLAHVVVRELGSVRTEIDRVLGLPQLNDDDAAAPINSKPRPTVASIAASPVTRIKRAETNGSEIKVSGVEQRVLDALRELEEIGVEQPEREIVSFMAGYSNIRSKGFTNAIGALRTAGHIEYLTTGTLTLTPSGRAIAAIPDIAPTTEAIRDRIVKMLGGASTKILDPLIAAYPEDMERDGVAALAGYTNVRSKGFTNALGRLRTLGFVQYPSQGTLRAGDLLFPGGRP